MFGGQLKVESPLRGAGHLCRRPSAAAVSDSTLVWHDWYGKIEEG